MDRLKLYMRLVVVAALFVLGAVGVYKGRTILKGSKTAQGPSKLKTGKKSDAKDNENNPEAADPNQPEAGNAGADPASSETNSGSLYGAGDGENTASTPTGEEGAGGENTSEVIAGEVGTDDESAEEETQSEDESASAYGDVASDSSGSTYGSVGDEPVAENESQDSQESTETEMAEEESSYAAQDDNSSEESPSTEESDVAANEPAEETDTYEQDTEEATAPNASELSDAGDAAARLRQRLKGQPAASVNDTDPAESEPVKPLAIAPSNVRIPQEAEESSEEASSEDDSSNDGSSNDGASATKMGMVDRARTAAGNLFGNATQAVRAKPEERYANDPAATDANADEATPEVTEEPAESEAPPAVAPEAEEAEEEETSAPATSQPEPGVAPYSETEDEQDSVAVPNEQAAPAPSNTVPAESIPSVPIPSAPRTSAPRSSAPAASSGRNPPRMLPDYGSDAGPSDRIRSTSSSGRMAEGPQSPNVVLEKFAPPEVQVGQPATFELVVRNLGDAAAHRVTVEEEIPEGTEYHSASPEPTGRTGRKLTWDLGSLPPDEEKGIRLQLTPVSEGEIALSAQVHFQAQADARSVATRPVLEVLVDSPAQVHAGDELPLRITISNQGSGAATDVLIEEDVPTGFTHPRGRTLQYRVGTLGPGKSKTVVLKLKAEEAGRHRNALAVSAAGGIVRREETNIDVVAPSLKLGVSGPKRKYLDAQAIHVLTLENPGTAPAHNVEVVAHLPRGLKFVAATNHGAYDASRHAVYWDLEQLPPGQQGAVRFTTQVEDTGVHRIEAEARAAEGVHIQTEYEVKADASSEVQFTVSDLSDPIVVGEETYYEIRLANRGARDATGVTVQATFPKEIHPLAVEGDVQGTVAGNKVTFQKIARMGVGQSLVLRIAAKAREEGDGRVAVSVSSDDSKTPVIHQEATLVHRDE